jgi:serine/threonine protein kinase
MDKDKKKNYNLIPERKNTITNMLVGTNLDSIMDFKSSSETNNSDNTTKSDDIRELMPKRYIDFGKAVSDLGGKLLYIKSGSTGHTFKGVYPPLENGNLDPRKPYAVKIVAYPKKENYGDMYNIKRPENAELMMIKLLSQFVINSETPHVVLPITTFNTSIKPFLSLTKNNIVDSKKFEQFVEKYEKGEYYQNVSVLISEWANGGDLLDYIRKNYKSFKIRHWRTIFFQILSVLAIIQAKYPSFRHNDLKGNNLLVNLIDMSKKKYKYIINNQIYIVPNIGFQLKLWDFDFACIPGIVDNSKVDSDWTNKINITPQQNRYYDVHYFFNTFTRKGFFPEFWTEKEIPDKVKEFVKRVVPEKYTNGKLVSEKGRILVNDEFLIADEILKNDIFFKVMRDNIKERDSE